MTPAPQLPRWAMLPVKTEDLLGADRRGIVMSVDKYCAHDAEPLCDNSALTLVMRARDGEERAWAALVERYAPLIWSFCRRCRLDATDTADVSQNVWLLLVNELGKIRDPAALPGWLATTTRRECTRVLNRAQVRHVARYEPDADNIPDGEAETIEQGLLAAERHAALREALIHLSPRDQQLIALLIEDPPVPYAAISTRLGIPVGSIGPNRRRCLDKLRHHPAVAALISPEAQTA
jgi:RNA polymerase sigma factor (sigma-70 family)